MADCKPHSTPCEMDIKKTSDKVDLIDSKSYRKIIGYLIYEVLSISFQTYCDAMKVCLWRYIYIYTRIIK